MPWIYWERAREALNDLGIVVRGRVGFALADKADGVPGVRSFGFGLKISGGGFYREGLFHAFFERGEGRGVACSAEAGNIGLGIVLVAIL